MPPDPQWMFGPFRLDPDNACVWHGAQTMTLKPKSFDVLQYLVAHAGQLVTKEALFGAIWPEVAVGDAVLKVCIGEIRKALGDTAKTPQFIATVHRRGYRFIAPVTIVEPGEAGRPLPPLADPPLPDIASPSHPSSAPPPTSLLERDDVLHHLHTALEQVRAGARQVVFATGEPGIGKTAVVEAFLAQAAKDPYLWMAQGQCVEHFGPGEPYLPVLEALGQLCRAPGGERLIALLRQQAPTWLVQMPWLLSATDRGRLQHELQGATRERMLRELAELVETVTAETPLILVLEDLHWSDYATLDLLAMLEASMRRWTGSRSAASGWHGNISCGRWPWPVGRMERWQRVMSSPMPSISRSPTSDWGPGGACNCTSASARVWWRPMARAWRRSRPSWRNTSCGGGTPAGRCSTCGRRVPRRRRALAMAGDLRELGLDVVANYYLGETYRALSDYRRAVDFLRKSVGVLHGDLVHERFGLAGFPSVLARVYLAACLAEVGAFSEGLAVAEEAMRIAQEASRPYDVILASTGIGLVCFRKGDFHRVIAALEAGLRLCQVNNVPR